MTSSTESTRQEIGHFLRRAREEAGLSVRDLAHRTRIGGRHIEALEAGDFDALQGFIFVRGFVTAICKELRRDPTEALAMLKTIEPEEPSPAPPLQAREGIRTRPNSRREASSPAQADRRESFRGPMPLALLGGFYLALAAALGALVLVMTGVIEVGKGSGTPAPYEPPAAVAQPAAAPAPDQAALAPSPAAPPAPSSPSALAAAGAVRPAPSGSQPLRLRVVAVEKTWLKIQADDESPQEVTLRKDGTALFVAQDHFTLTIGNAGGVTFSLNDRQMGPPGAPGQVLSNYILNRDNL